jgi:O-antigen ligase
MVNDGIVAESHTAPRASWIDEAVFLAFLLLAFVGLTPFAVQAPQVTAFGGVATTGAGDLARQLCYLAVLAAVLIEAARKRGFASFSTLPLMLLLLLAWCVASAAWSGEPLVSIRRAGLAVVLVLCAMLSVEIIGVNRALVLLRWVLLAVLIVNWLSIPLIPQAVHLPGEEDPNLVGDWRGLYGHKNIAGSVGAMTAIVFLFSPRETKGRRFFDIAVALAAIAFTVMTRSKSSLGLLAIALVLGLIYRFAWKKDLDRVIVVVAGAALFVLAAALIIADQGVLMRLFEDPDEFTGRTEIWQAEIAFIRDHALLGAGFGTFSDTGGLSPLHNYIGNSWVSEASHGHNGYLQILVTTGAVGFALAFVSLIVEPAMELWRRGGDLRLKALLFALFAFLLLHNLMETDFLEGDGVTWVAFLLILAMLGRMRRGEPA